MLAEEGMMRLPMKAEAEEEQHGLQESESVTASEERPSGTSDEGDYMPFAVVDHRELSKEEEEDTLFAAGPIDPISRKRKRDEDDTLMSIHPAESHTLQPVPCELVAPYESESESESDEYEYEYDDDDDDDEYEDEKEKLKKAYEAKFGFENSNVLDLLWVEEYFRQVFDSEGFEVDYFPLKMDHWEPNPREGIIQPLPLYECGPEIDTLLQLAVKHYNYNRNNMGYNNIRDPMLIKVNECQRCWYFITFAALDGAGGCDLYRAGLQSAAPPDMSLVKFCKLFKKCDPPYRPRRQLDAGELCRRYNSIVEGISVRCISPSSMICKNWDEYIRQVVDSDGFDVDYFPGFLIKPYPLYGCYDEETINALVDLAIEHYNRTEEGVMISNSEPPKILKATRGYLFTYFITFEAKGDAGERNIYRARVQDCTGKEEEYEVVFCTLFKRAVE